MKRIYLLRHAKAEKNVLCEDFERKITKEGKENLKQLFKNLKKLEFQTQIIVSSPAKRTKMTAKRLAKFCELSNEKLIYNDEIYEASVDELFEILKNFDDNCKSLTLVGHNPALGELAELLSSLCIENFATSAMLGLEFDIQNFKELKIHSGKILFFENVRALEKD